MLPNPALLPELQIAPCLARSWIRRGLSEVVSLDEERQVDRVLDLDPLARAPAQLDVSYSNSIIEAWWCSLRHQWLCLNQLDTIASVRESVSRHVSQHEEVLPHAAFDGQRLDEMHLGRGGDVAREAGRSVAGSPGEANGTKSAGDVLPLRPQASGGPGGMRSDFHWLPW